MKTLQPSNHSLGERGRRQIFDWAHSGAMLAVGLMLVVGILLLFLRLKKPLPPTTHAKTIVILGSGGHTTEMIQLLDSLLRCRRYSPRVYVVASTDILSCHKAYEMERDLGAEMNGDGLYSEVDEFIDEFDIFQFHIVKIPRSREVGQSWPSVVVSFTRAFIRSVVVVVMERPNLVVCRFSHESDV